MRQDYIYRLCTARLLKLMKHFSCIVITGARQVGKTSLVQHVLSDFDYVVFDPVIDIENARQDPELFLRNHPPPLILDEIQYAPELIPVLKRWIDRDKQPGQYLLTGSQQWEILKSISESLAGRAVFLDMESLSLAEIAGAPNDSGWLSRFLDNPESFLQNSGPKLIEPRTLYEQLWRGFLPEVQSLPTDLIPSFHTAYMRTYVERDIRKLADLPDINLFSRFVQLTAALTAQEINHSQLGRELGISPHTAKHWLQLLRGTFQWFEIPAFSRNSVKLVSSKPKGYVTDTGQACFAQSISSPTALGGHPLWGAIFETAVVLELRKQAALMESKPSFFHWRRHSGTEVDLILERDGKLFPIEIKANSRPSRKDARGIVAFRRNYPELAIGPGLILAPAENCYPVNDNDWVLPWNTQ